MSRLETIFDFSILSEESTSKPKVNFKHKDKPNIINVVPDLKNKELYELQLQSRYSIIICDLLKNKI